MGAMRRVSREEKIGPILFVSFAKDTHETRQKQDTKCLRCVLGEEA